MKKVLFIMPDMAGGGAERVVSILMNELVNRGVEVTLALTKDDAIVYTLDQHITVDKRYMGKGKNPLIQILDIRKLMLEDCERVVVSFLDFQNLYTILAGLFLRNKVVVSLRNALQMLGDGRKSVQILTKVLFGFADKVVFQTNDAQKAFSKKVQKKSAVILNPLSKNFPEYKVENSKKKIVTFCRLNAQKNLPLAINGFSEFHKTHMDYNYVIYGKGEEESSIRNLITELGLENCITLNDFSKNIFEDIKDARMFILTSDYEGMSNSMIEAMALGLPSICTDCPIGGARMVIDNGINGFLIPVGGEDALVKAMKEIADNAENRKNMSENAKKIRERLSVSKIVDKWENVLFK